MTGMHHSFIAIETQLLADSAHTGGSFIFSTASMNNVAQGAAVLAVLLMTKNDKMKSICSASGISALLGITEPAMFGVTLKLKYPFYAAMLVRRQEAPIWRPPRHWRRHWAQQDFRALSP